MNKATIIEDAITYILMLQRNVNALSEQLLEGDSLFVEENEQSTRDEIDASEQMKNYGIKVQKFVHFVCTHSYIIYIMAYPMHCITSLLYCV